MKSFLEHLLEEVGEKSFPSTTNHGWWQDSEHLHVYHGTHKRNIPSIKKSGIDKLDPVTGMVSMTLDPHTAHGYAAMSGEHLFRKAGNKAVVTPHEDRAVTHWKIPMSWAREHLDTNMSGNLGDARKKMLDKNEYKKWKTGNPTKSDHEYYATTEFRFKKAIPPEFYQGHSFRTKK